MQSSEKPAANRGLIRPPVIYLCALIAGWTIDYFWPVGLPFAILHIPLGALFFIAAMTLFFLTQREFHVANTPVPGNRPTTSLVQSGTLRFSRNPIYLAFSLAGAGIAIGTNSLWVFVTLIPAVGVMQFVVIPREEQYLLAKFGPEYLAYKSSVRRWI